DADDVAVGQLPVDRRERALHDAGIFLCHGYRDGLGGAEHVLHDRRFEDLVVHHEAHRPAHAAHDDQRIHEADVVAYEQHRTVFRNVFQPGGTDAVERVDQQPVDETQQEFRHQGINVYRDHG